MGNAGARKGKREKWRMLSEGMDCMGGKHGG